MKKWFLSIFSFAVVVALIAFPQASQANGQYHTVKNGDSLWNIAKVYQVNLADLFKENQNIIDLNQIFPQQQIKLPDHWFGKPQQPSQPEQEAPEQEQPQQEAPEQEVPEQEQPQQPEQPDSNQPGTSPGGSNGQQPEPTTPQPEQGQHAWEQQVVELVNVERAREGLSALQWDSHLADVARAKSADMRDNNYFSHDSPTYGSPFDMMRQYGVQYRSAGENIAAGQRSPQEVVQAWMDSPGHRQNIMSSGYTHIGVGFVEGGSYGYYWTQMFISK